ncbi:MAG: response regulator [Rhodocyclaceae bacterium]|nr:response regulator [Rhodocyclaceae bacterium]MCB1929813.1 response regulator [Rhodocyclaceae bacterium]
MNPLLKVLVVDDSRVSRMMSSAMIKSIRAGVEIVEADNGDAALLAQKATPCDIGILDMNMPGMTGLELAAHLHRLNPDMPLALLTANVQDSVRNRADEEGVHFFRKPVREEVIGQILDTLAPQR